MNTQPWTISSASTNTTGDPQAHAAETRVFLQPMSAGDAPLLRAFFGSLSPQTLYQRYFMPLPFMSGERIAAEIERLKQAATYGVVLLGRFAHADAVVVVAEAVRLPDQADTAELAITVADAYQRQGIGRQVTAELPQVLRHYGLTRLRATALAENRAIARLFAGSGAATRMADGLMTFQVG